MRSYIGLVPLLFLYISKTFGQTPDPRVGQTDNLIGSIIYFVGGNNGKSNTNDVVYLNLTESFSTDSPQWDSMEGGNAPVAPSFSTSVISPFDGSTLYLIGGFTTNPTSGQPNFSNPIYTCDTIKETWNTLSVSGNLPTQQQENNAVVDGSGKAYIFGGAKVTNFAALRRRFLLRARDVDPSDGYVITDTSNVEFSNSMNVLNIDTNSWVTIPTVSNTPPPRIDYTATLLDNGNIVYIGGREYSNNSLGIVDSNKINIFDTKSLGWSTMVATGVGLQKRQLNTIQSRLHHTAVLTKKGQIIVYGGEDLNSKIVEPGLVALDTTKKIFNWYIPPSSAGPYNAPPLSKHSATLYGDTMIVTFGYVTNTGGVKSNFNKNIYILNATSFSWVRPFGAPPSSPPPTTTIA